MSFKFKMQKVLDYREQLEEEAKVKLAAAEYQLLMEKRRAEQLNTMLAEQEHKLYHDVEITWADRWLLENFVKGLRSDLSSCLLQVRNMENLVHEARKLLTERAKDKKLLEKLKSRQNEQYLRDENLKEQRTNDETATLRYKAPSF